MIYPRHHQIRFHYLTGDYATACQLGEQAHNEWRTDNDPGQDDHLVLRVHVGENARAQVTTTSATRIYRNAVDKPASFQLNEIEVGENAVFELLPDPLIPFAQSSYRQRTQIKLAEGAGLFWWETVAPGREARGERFDYELLGLEVDIQANGRHYITIL